MRNKTVRRLLAGLGVAGAFVAAASPVSAQASDVELSVYFSNTTVAVGSTGKVDYPIVFSSAPVVVYDITVQYDLTDLVGKVEISEESTSDDCTSPSPNVLVCSDPFGLPVNQNGIGAGFPIAIVPTSGAQIGDEGNLEVSFSAAGYPAVTSNATIRVGEGVDLAAGPETTVTAAPGDSFTSPLVVRNIGTTTATGVSVLFDNDHAIQPIGRYSNCLYQGDRLKACHFTTSMSPGGTYTATLPYVLGVDAYAPGRTSGYSKLMTRAEFDDFAAYLQRRSVSLGEPGTEGELALTEISGVRTQDDQADTDPTNAWSGFEITVTGVNGTDLYAIGDSVTGNVGDVVTATVGFGNNGPASLDYTRPGSVVTKIDVNVPAGTTAVSVPDSCLPRDGSGIPGKPGMPSYRCYPGSFSKVGEQHIVELGLRIDSVIPNAAGKVTINAICQCEGFVNDLDPSNDMVQLLVNAS
ncbi:LPXTG cell wall anchor domain-containing protein [Micromonospora sp. NPDC003197]